MILNSILELKDSRREVHLNIKIDTIIKKESLNEFRFFSLLSQIIKKRESCSLFLCSSL
jgi:hypothetical protein